MEFKKLYSISKNLNILYVEDEEKVRERYSHFFEKIFDRVDLACDGEDGLIKYRNFYEQESKYYDLVISDIAMPKMDGIELSKNILNEHKEQQILIISAYNDSDKLQSLMDLGIHYFMQKPMEFEKIIAVLERACSYIVHQKAHNENTIKMEQTINTLKEKLDKAVEGKNNFEEDVFDIFSLIEDYPITSLTDSNGIIMDVNDEFLRISGYQKNELLGESFDKIRDKNTSKKILGCMKMNNICRYEIKNIKKGSEEECFWTALIVLPMVKNGTIYGFKLIEENISEQKSIDSIVYDIFGDINDEVKNFL